jgi:hypothetical protein
MRGGDERFELGERTEASFVRERRRLSESSFGQ